MNESITWLQLNAMLIGWGLGSVLALGLMSGWDAVTSALYRWKFARWQRKQPPTPVRTYTPVEIARIRVANLCAVNANGMTAEQLAAWKVAYEQALANLATAKAPTTGSNDEVME